MSKSKFDGVVLTSLEKRIEAGQMFEASNVLSVANVGATGHWLFRTGKKKVVITGRRVTTNGDEITYQAFREPTTSADGTPITPVNRNANSKIKSTVETYFTPTVSAPGAGLPSVYMPGATGQGNSTVGQFDRDGLIRILEPNTTYLTRVTNDGAKNPANIELYLQWVELDDPLPQE